MKAVFRCDASRRVGWGHLRRCQSVAAVLKRNGWTCGFAVRLDDDDDPAELLSPLAADILDLRGAPNDPADADTMRRHWPDGCNVLFADSYDLDHHFETACRPWADRVVVFDDLANRRHDADLLIDHNAGRNPGDYHGLVPKNCRICAGPGFALLAPPFARARGAVVPRKSRATPPPHILVSLGGTDPENRTAIVLDGLSRIARPLQTTVVVSDDARAQVLKDRFSDGAVKFRVAVTPDEMARLVAAADLAVGAGGVSMLERCCLGLPSIVILTADNQHPGATALAARGACRVLGTARDVEAADIGAAVKTLLGDSGALSAMSRAASGVCDGRGAVRISTALQPDGNARDGTSVSLVMAGESDCDRLFEWQSHPETRRHARNPRPPGRAEHEAWFADRLARGSCIFNVVLFGDEPAGVLRLDRTDAPREGYEVSIAIAPERFGQGIAAAALRQAPALVEGAPLWAFIAPANDRSCALFLAAGYRPAGDDWYCTAA